ncbi:hypothetical protein CMK14_10025 [Candidatus Poribacteria bacterium]|nr:hypothetical protein [Candidatus Poribacteria bacterium]
MLIIDDRQFVLTKFDSEAELERVVIENAEYIFGPSSIYFPKFLIRTTDGTSTVPDSYGWSR